MGCKGAPEGHHVGNLGVRRLHTEPEDARTAEVVKSGEA